MKRLQSFVASTTVEDRVSLENNISELEGQLNQLREKLANNEERHQKQLTMLGALGSAIEQVCNAIKLCEDGGEPGLVDTFWEELGDIQSGDYVFTKALPQYVDNNEENEKLLSMKLSEIKEYAANIGLTNSYVKTFGSVRSKITWIDAINAFQLEKSTEDNDPIISPPNVQTSDSDNVNATDLNINNEGVIDVFHNDIPDDSVVDDVDNPNNNPSPSDIDDDNIDEWGNEELTATGDTRISKPMLIDDW